MVLQSQGSTFLKIQGRTFCVNKRSPTHLLLKYDRAVINKRRFLKASRSQKIGSDS